MIRLIRNTKKTLEFDYSKIKSTKIKYGIIAGKKMYGNIHFNRRLDILSDEEEFYKILDLKGKVIVELGANLGYYTIYFSLATGENGKVYSFEPNPIIYNLLKKNLIKNNCKNVTSFNFGVGDKDTKLTFISKKFILETGSFDESLQENLKADIYGFRSWDMTIKKLDSLKGSQIREKVDFLKVDVEGMEMEALIGAKNLIESDSPDIYLEIHGKNNDIKVGKLEGIINFLKSINAGYNGIHLPDCMDVNIIVTERMDIDFKHRTKIYTYDNYAFFFSTDNDFSWIKQKFGDKKYWRIR